MVETALTSYFSKKIPEVETISIENRSEFLTNILLLAANAADRVDDLRLIRQGAVYLDEQGHAVGSLAVRKQACFDAFRLIQEIPEESSACLIEVVKIVGGIGAMAAGSTGGTSDAVELAESLTTAVGDIRFPLDPLFEQSGFICTLLFNIFFKKNSDYLFVIIFFVSNIFIFRVRTVKRFFKSQTFNVFLFWK